MLRPSILTLRQKISGHKVSMSRHSALCHDGGVRRCVTNKVGCVRDRVALPRMIEELCHPRQTYTRDWDACTTEVRARQR